VRATAVTGQDPVGFAGGDADWIVTQAAEPRAGDDRPVEPVEPAELGSEADEPEADPEQARSRPARKSRRASVPSWDEIMFGGKRD
jgi:hypothetical protein